VTHSGKVTPRGDFRVGGGFSYNAPQETFNRIFGSLEKNINNLEKADSLYADESFRESQAALAMWSLDPIGMNMQLSARYGIWDGFDLGFTYAGGVKVYDARYQFLGSRGTWKDSSISGSYGSMGIQYSSQEYELPSYLGKLQSLLGYKLERKDVLIPVVFSKSFGQEEKYGSVGYGFSLGHSWIRYEFDVQEIYEFVEGKVQEVSVIPQGKGSYWTYGGFVNLALGYKYIYFIPSFSVYYQDYGTYTLIADEKESFSGLTFVPYLGLELRF